METCRFSSPEEEHSAIEGGADAGTDRRGADRLRTVCRIAKIVRDGDVGLWRVRNISDRGMMLAADVNIEVNEQLEVWLSDRIAVKGRVVWAREGRCGVELDAPIDVPALLRDLAAEQRTNGYRPPRLPVQTPAKAVHENRTSDITLVDMSQSGAGFVHNGGLAIGTEIELVLDCGLRRKAIVRWARGDRGGLWLTQPLGRAELESIRNLQG